MGFGNLTDFGIVSFPLVCYFVLAKGQVQLKYLCCLCSIAGTAIANSIATDCCQQEFALSSANCCGRTAGIVSKTKFIICATTLQCLATDKY